MRYLKNVLKKITEDQNLDFPLNTNINRLKPLFLIFFKLDVHFGQHGQKEEVKLDLGEPTDEFKNTIEELK